MKSKQQLDTMNRWGYALWAPDVRELIMWVTCATAAFISLAVWAADLIVSGFFLVLASIFAALLTSLVRSGLHHYDIHGRAAVELAASRWAQAGRSEAEVKKRYEEIESLGSVGALAAAGIAGAGFGYLPDINVDGTAMIPGSGVDLNGNLYGVTQEQVDFDIGGGMDFTTGMSNDGFDSMDMHTSMHDDH